MMIYKTRYQAQKAKTADPYYKSDDRIVKVCGGYTIMAPRQYAEWRTQK